MQCARRNDNNKVQHVIHCITKHKIISSVIRKKTEVDSKPVGNASTRASTYAQTAGQPKNVMPPALSTGWAEAYNVYNKITKERQKWYFDH